MGSEMCIRDSAIAPADGAPAGASCALLASARATAGAASSEVPVRDAASGEAVATAYVRVWFPLDAQLVLLSGASPLRPLDGADGAAPNGLYEAARVALVSPFGGDGLETTALLDVTRLASIVSDAPSVVSLERSALTGSVRARGVSAGDAMLFAANATPPIALHLNVSDEQRAGGAGHARLEAFAVERVDIAVTAAPPGGGGDDSGSGSGDGGDGAALHNARASVPAVVLTSALARARVVAVARLADGGSWAVAASELRLSALSPSVRVRAPAEDSGEPDAWTVGATEDAPDAAGELVLAVWVDASGMEVARANVSLAVRLSPIASLVAQPSAPRVAAPGASASEPPASVPSAFELLVLAQRSDGSSERVLGTDARLTVEIEPLGCAVAVGLTVTVVGGEPCDGVQSVRVSATLALADGRNETVVVAVPLVRVRALAVLAKPWPAFPPSDAANISALRRIGASSAYQRAAVVAVALLTDGTRVDVSARAELAVDDAMVAALLRADAAASADGSDAGGDGGDAGGDGGDAGGDGGDAGGDGGDAGGGWVLAGLAPGVVRVNASWAGGRHDASVVVDVLDERVPIVGIALSTPLERAPGTFGGPRGAEAELRVDVVLGDGTRLPHAQRLPHVQLGELVALTSSEPDALLVVVRNGSATVRLLANSAAPVELRAAAVGAHGGASASLVGAANLAPRAGDVDVGAEDGLQLVARPDGRLELPIVLNTRGVVADAARNDSADGAGANATAGSAAPDELLNFQIELSVDATALRAVSCAPAFAWATGAINDPPTALRLAGDTAGARAAGEGGAAGDALLVASVVFEVVDAASDGAGHGANASTPPPPPLPPLPPRAFALGGTIVELLVRSASGELARVRNRPIVAGASLSLIHI